MEFLKELFKYVKARKKWWLLPLFILLLIVGLVIMFANSTLAPFIYSLF